MSSILLMQIYHNIQGCVQANDALYAIEMKRQTSINLHGYFETHTQ